LQVSMTSAHLLLDAALEQSDDFLGGASFGHTWEDAADAIGVTFRYQIGHSIDSQCDIEPKLIGVTSCRFHTHAGGYSYDYHLANSFAFQILLQICVGESAGVRLVTR